MEKIKATLTVDPKDRPTLDEWIKQFNFGSRAVKLEELKMKDRSTDLNKEYDLSKINFKI